MTMLPNCSPAMLRRPAAHPMSTNVSSLIDNALLDRAVNERSHNAGTSLEAFRHYNVAIIKAQVDGRTTFLEAGNFPQRYGGLMHSEEYLISQVHELGGNDNVVVEQIYSERIPCWQNCMPKIRENWPHADVFYTVRSRIHIGPMEMSKARQLMVSYGVPG